MPSILTVLPIVLIFTAMSSSCQKDVIDRSSSFSETTGDGITNFTDLSTSQIPKSEHPFFQALDPQRYYFAIEGSKPCCGQDGQTAVAGITPDFTRNSTGNVGDIQIGNYTFVPGPDNSYGGPGDVDEPISEPSLLENFGKQTAFNFKGSGNLNPFSGTLYFPQLLTFSNINDVYSSLTLSRNANHKITYLKDVNNQLPLLVEVYWIRDEHMDPDNADHKYKVVTNLFLVDDNGNFTLSEDVFKDIPKKAKLVHVTLWRGNSAKDDQGIYFLASTKKSFSVQLTD